MQRLTSISLACLIVLQAPFAAAQATQLPPSALSVPADQALAASIEARLAPYFKADEPGATVIVVKDGKTVLRKAYGMADVEKHQPMDAAMSLRLGSITKQFTAVSILMLAEQGKLALSDDITKFLPDYPTHGKTITIEHLLTHTSGIVNYTSRRGFGANSDKDLSVAQMIATFKDDPLEFDPGTRFSYSNSGYFLLGAIIEKVSGVPYAKFVEQRIFVPLGMTQTAYEGHERTPTVRAAGHSRLGTDGFGPSAPLSMSQPFAAGALVSTVDDMARWDAALTAGTLLKPASLERATTSYRLADGSLTHYGYGWQIETLQGHTAITHSGGINGFSTHAIRLPDDKVYVAVLRNSDENRVGPDTIAETAAALAIGKPFPDLKAIKLDAKALDAFTGDYRIDDKTTRTITRDNGRLMMRRTGRPAVEIVPYSDHGFFLENTLVRIEFGRDADGHVNQLTMFQHDLEQVSPRQPAVH
jgi:D-alanyl-D-alanine carboxypeptidase